MHSAAVSTGTKMTPVKDAVDPKDTGVTKDIPGLSTLIHPLAGRDEI